MNAQRLWAGILLASTLMTGAVAPQAQAGNRSPATPTPASYRQGACGNFTIAVIPDTQNYTDFRHQSTSGFKFDAVEQYYGQMRWIRANARSNGGDIVFATHLGDVWQHYARWMDPGHAARGFRWVPNGGSEVARSPKVQVRGFEIPVAVQGFELIADALPFSVVPGNHDYDALWTDPAHPPSAGSNEAGVRHVGGLTGFVSAFSSESAFFRNQPWYVGAHDGGADSAQLFTAGQCHFLHIGLQYHAPDGSLAWAADVLRRYPGIPTIVTTHDYLRRDGTRNRQSNPNNATLDPIDNDPQMMWDAFISQNSQIFMVLSGHIGGQGFSVDRNRAGQAVYQVMSDYQGRGQSAKDAGAPDTDIGDGWLRLMQFSLDGAQPQIRVRTYSTHYGHFASDMPTYANWYKDSEGQAALSDADFVARDEFTIPLTDFHQRFGAPRP